VTRNSSHFKKLLADDSTTFRTSQSHKGEGINLDTDSSSPPGIPVSVQESTDSPVDPGGNAEILTEPVLKVCTCICAPKETYPKDLISDDSLF